MKSQELFMKMTPPSQTVCLRAIAPFKSPEERVSCQSVADQERILLLLFNLFF